MGLQKENLQQLGWKIPLIPPGDGATKLVPLDPGSLNLFMQATSIDFGAHGNVNWDITVRHVGLSLPGSPKKPRFATEITDSQGNSIPIWNVDSNDDPDGARQFLQAALCQGHPVVVGVEHCSGDACLKNGKSTFPCHYVLVTGQQGDRFLINDPCGTPKTTVDFSGAVTNDSYGHFVGRGFVLDPAGDISGLDLAVGDNGELLVTDASGRRTGFDISANKEIGEIPHSAHFADSLQDDEIGGLVTGTNHSVQIFQPVAGNYQASVIGLSPGVFVLSLTAFSSDGTAQSAISLPGIAGIGSTSTFQIQYSSTPGTTTTVARVASFQSTLADIANSLAIGLIDNAGIANSLTRKIQAAANAAAEAESEDAKEELKSFKHEISAQTGKHLTGVAPQVLLEDADSLISQLR